jgi:uncharacterized coiled-coil DUF342 family protein
MNDQRFELSTGIFVLPESWNDKKQQVNGRTEETKILNNRRDKICTRVPVVSAVMEEIKTTLDERIKEVETQVKF